MSNSCWQSIPLDILIHCFEFLSFHEVSQSVSLCCKYWRFSWKLFTSVNSSCFRSFSSIKQTSDDLFEMMHQASEQPLIRALTDFMLLNDLLKRGDMSYLLKSATFNVETVNPPGYLKLFKSFKVRHVNQFAELPMITNRALDSICSLSLNSLTELSMENCTNVDTRVARAIANCSHLVSVNFSFSRLNEEGLSIIVEGCKNLRILILRGVQRLGTNALASIGKTKVEVLDLSHSVNIVGSQSVTQSLQDLPLSQLSLNGLDITDSDLSMLHAQINLKLLSLSNCHRLSDLSLVHISKVPSLLCLNLDCYSYELCQYTEMTMHHVLKCYCRLVSKLQVPQHLASHRLKQLIRSRQ
mmetsp:Transcript_13543/g.25520  ORF Transcript_13543/g.25520 Transcript_13543/m.25520 type:complete len:355 (+) Transcript_13543:299-1363(+)